MAEGKTGSGRVPTSGPAAELLDRVIEYLTRTGDVNVSLRQLAAETDTSHRMLIYHFNTRVELMVTVLFALDERDPLIVPISMSREEYLRTSWSNYRTPGHQLYLALFFAASDYGAQATKEELEPLRQLSDRWAAPYIALGMSEGLTEAEARSEVIAIVACQRGLHNDLMLRAYDEDTIDAAFEALVAMVTRRDDIQ